MQALGLASNVVASFKTKHAAEGALLLTIDKLIKRSDQQGHVFKKSKLQLRIR